MILSAQTIRRFKIIEPFDERVTSSEFGMTYGLSAAGYDIRIAEDLKVPTGGYVALGSSIERFDMPHRLLGVVHDKSTWARKGLFVQNTVIEPGWRGHLTLELTNASYHPIELQAGMPIAQIIFHLLDTPTEQPYTGKYQDQPAGPQPAILERK